MSFASKMTAFLLLAFLSSLTGARSFSQTPTIPTEVDFFVTSSNRIGHLTVSVYNQQTGAPVTTGQIAAYLYVGNTYYGQVCTAIIGVNDEATCAFDDEAPPGGQTLTVDYNGSGAYEQSSSTQNIVVD
jgi:hypothetical protein